MKHDRLAVQAVLVTDPSEPDFRRDIDQQGEIGLETGRRNPVQCSQLVEVEPSAVALVHESGVRETIAQDDRPLGECGTDQVGDVLGPIGEKEEELAAGAHRLDVGVQQDLADPNSYRPRPGLTRDDDGSAASSQRFGDRSNRRALAGAFRSLERDEHP